MTTKVCPRRRSFRPLLALAFFVCSTTVSGAPAQSPPGDEQMPIPGGARALLEKLGIPGSVEPARALLVLIRAAYGGPAGPQFAPLSLSAAVPEFAASNTGRTTTDHVPALLPLAVWRDNVFRKPIDEQNLVREILGDRRAALLYYGLFSLDDPTLEFLAAHPSVLSAIYDNGSPVFAAFAESITVRDGRVVLPGVERDGQPWQDLVGAPADAPAEFVPMLLTRGDGRLAWMFDAIAHLDSAHQSLALGRYLVSARDRYAHINAVYRAFAMVPRDLLDLNLYPFERPPFDPAFVLGAVAVTDSGTLAPSSASGVWREAFGRSDRPFVEDGTAPWLLERVMAGQGRAKLDALLFGQRLLAAADTRGVSVVPETTAAVLKAYAAGHEALMLALEGLGLSDPRDYARAADTATRLTSGNVPLRASLHAAMFQGALALIVRMHEVGTLDDDAARRLAVTLAAVPVASADGYGIVLAEWIERQLIPTLAAGRGQKASNDAGAWLLDGLSGTLTARVTPIVEWEEHSYRVDIAGAERARLRRLLDNQRACALSMAFELRTLISRVATIKAGFQPDDPVRSRLADLVSGIDLLDGGTIFGAVVPAHPAVRTALRNLRTAVPQAIASEALSELRDLMDLLMADIMAAHVYAIAVEDPDSSIWLADRPARRHDFGLAQSGHPSAWMLPVDVSPVIRGSLLGLGRTLAPYSVRRTTLELPAVAPGLSGSDLVGLAQAALGVNAFRLTDAGQKVITSGLRRGRDRIAAAAKNPATLDAAADRIGAERWRRRLMRWAASREPATVGRYLSLGEILALGSSPEMWTKADAWGVPGRALDGSLGTRLPMPLAWHSMVGRRGAAAMPAQVPDLPLRIAEVLAELKLPAVLAHGVLQYAAWDVSCRVRMTYPDDWLELMHTAQALTADEVTDYVSALTADGAMVPVK